MFMFRVRFAARPSPAVDHRCARTLNANLELRTEPEHELRSENREA